MTDALLIILLVLAVAMVILQVITLFRSRSAQGIDPATFDPHFNGLREGHERTERNVREEITRNREESQNHARSLREEVGKTIRQTNDSLVKTITELSKGQHERFGGFNESLVKLIETNEKKLESLRLVLDRKITELQQDNAKKLDEMRKTVDEKLQGTLEKRLGESFKQVSERLEQVHKGLGEMQNLATGVGDLKRVMTNVKTRGVWGEYLLENLLEQCLTPDQYQKNVATKSGSNDRVEFAVKLPGESGITGETVWLPIDSKWPKEDYERLVDAQEAADVATVEEASKALERQIKECAKTISAKYIDPPHTMNYAILFLPTEGLYAEVLRRPGLADHLHREYRVNVAGPTTLSAILNALQMGFHTLAIQKRSSEVWDVLGAVKTEFGKFGGVLGKIKKKLQEASNTVEQAETRTRVMGRRLKKVEELPTADAQQLLGMQDESLEDVMEEPEELFVEGDES